MFRKEPCKSNKKDGGPCAAWAIVNSEYCSQHTIYGPVLPTQPAEKTVKRKPGRPPIHGEEKWEAILEELRNGAEKAQACKTVGVPYETFRTKVSTDAAYKERVRVCFEEEGLLVYENTLSTAALNGHVPATKMILASRAPAKWAEKPQVVAVQDDRTFNREEIVANIIRIALELNKKREPNNIIDIEAIEPLAITPGTPTD